MAPSPRWQAVPGMGSVSTDSQIVGASAATVGAALPALVSAGLIASTAVPFIGAALAIVAIGIEELIANSGCGITCVETSSWANQAEPLLSQNIAAYFAQPAPRSQSSQALALQEFDKVWATLQQQCGQQGTGDAGKRCITDRQSGACTWKQTATSPLLSYPGEPQPGECWNWWNGYRDPIANDPDVAPDESSAVASAVSSAAGSVGAALSSVTSSSLFIPGLVVAGLVVVYMVTK